MDIKKPLRARVYAFIEKYGPVDMRDVLIGGVRTGYLRRLDSEKTVIAIVHTMLDCGEIVYIGWHRLTVSKK